MKKITLLLASFLVLISSIIFCGCNDSYKNLKITTNVEKIELVIDDENLCSTNLIFELSGAKSWGEVSIYSQPLGLVEVQYEIRDKQCAVKVNALYPTGDGATLVITHLGSGKSESVPLNIGHKLQTVASNGKNHIIQTPKFAENETVKEFEIPTKELLNCEPANYTDTIVWQTKDVVIPTGIKVVSYDTNGNQVPSFTQQGENLVLGVSSAVNSSILIESNCKTNTTLVLNPVSILDGKAVLHKNVEVKIAIVDLLYADDIVVTSDTHGRNQYYDKNNNLIDNGEIKDLVLINNPDSENPREVDGLTGFDFYSTAIIDFKRQVLAEQNKISLQHISELNSELKNILGKDLYNMEILTDINALTLQAVEFGKIRAIATSTCVGSGNIVVKFTPNACVGDVQEFSLTIPCTVGERATGFKATNDEQNIKIQKQDEYNFTSSTSLKDSSSIGQLFKFEVLGTNTLSTLKKYVIKIDKKLLYIAPLSTQPNDWVENWSNYYTYNQTSNSYEKVFGDVAPQFNEGIYYSSKNILTPNNDKVDLSNQTRFENLISILKDGKQIIFYDDGNGCFVSEPLTDSQDIYIKWVKAFGEELDNDDIFGIDICNYYDNSYDIKDNNFDKTIITYKLLFNRQRTVESISYVPVMVNTTNGIEVTIPKDAGDNWQFYFKQDMLSSNTGDGIYYGFLIQEVLGLNGTQLTEAELADIDVNISIDANSNIGFGLLNTQDYSISTYVREYPFNFVTGNTDYENIIIIGTVGEKAVCGDYAITMTQGIDEKSKCQVKVYMELTDDDVTVSIANAEFEGDLLQYQYVPMLEKPSGWNDSASDEYYANYYEFVGGEYIPANATWNVNKAYYISVALEYIPLSEKPDDWNECYNNYYELKDNEYIKIQSNDWIDSKTYYKKDKHFKLNNNDIMYLNNTYILKTSKEYDVNITIKDSGFRNISGKSVTREMVAYKGNPLSTIMINTSDSGDKIYTTNQGSFNTSTNQQNYIKLTYTIKADTYTYYKKNADVTHDETKVIYLYIYEPVTLATLDNTMIYKYDFDSIPNTQLKEEYGKHTLNININNNTLNMLNYANIKWSYTDAGIKEGGFELNTATSGATFTFSNKYEDIIATGNIVATIIQFGVQYPAIVCGYSVKKPVLTDEIVLNTKINNFASGDGFINLKVGESIQIEASAKSNKLDKEGNKLPISITGFNYIICSTTGYILNGVASINSDGLLTATSAGRAKLIIVAKDRMKPTTSVVTNYFNTGLYLENDAYLIVDIIVSDGSETNPFLIASANDFRNIANDYYYVETKDGQQVKINAGGDTTKVNDYHYALVGDIDLNGQPINFNNFSGTISSFQENSNLHNRFTIYGVMLDENNPNLFTTLNDDENGLAVLKDINIYIDINYVATGIDKNINIGLIGTNYAKIENVAIMVSGQIDANNLKNTYTIGSMVAVNAGNINITDNILVGVQGDIIVTNSGYSAVVLGGLVGNNQGSIQGANITSSIIGDGNEIEYEVYYDNQGATADVKLQVIAVGDLNNSAIGGIVGVNNNGKIDSVYSTGSILGTDQANKLTVNNVGGLIGKNNGDEFIINKTITTKQINDIPAIDTISFDKDAIFQINNSYSSAVVKGSNNVGGAVGYDDNGIYKKVYYEMYTNQQSITGNDNVGGLIGSAYDSNLYYCYANNFAWGYKLSVAIYDIVGVNNVGGLIGYAKSNRTATFADNKGAMNIVSSLASVSLNGTQNVSGLVGKLENYGAIYTAYFYGVINPSISDANLRPITKMYVGESEVGNIPYNNVYSIVNGEEKLKIAGEGSFYQGSTSSTSLAINGFNINIEYNNNKPYIVYVDENNIESNLVSIIPTKIEINQAFETENDGGYYNRENNKMYKYNVLGDYVWDKDEFKYVLYNKDIHNGWTRYSLMAEVVDTSDNSGNNSDYRAKALVLYYYQFTDMTGENALSDLYSLNTVNMHDIISDQGVIVLPNTLKRFNLRTSDSSIVSVLSGGRLLLNNEGQVTITLISTLNPSISASFVVIVRTKVLEFNLYSNANLKDEDNLTNPDNNTVSIVKNSSKIIYADYSSTIKNYAYNPATNMQLQFGISYNGNGGLPNGKSIRDYIILNGIYDKINEVYIIPYGTPITITVKEYIKDSFTITVRPYVIATYQNGIFKNSVPIELSNYFIKTFNVVTRQGASAINTDKTQINMMPADNSSKLDVKITTDIQVKKLYFEIEGDGGIANPKNPTEETIQFIEMLDIIYQGKIEPEYETNSSGEKVLAKGEIDIAETELKNFIQSFKITVCLNEKSHYVTEAFTLQVTFYVIGADGKRVNTTLHINVQPQEINSIISINYRMREVENSSNDLNFDKAYQSQIIRPGSTNIITVDIAPNIAIFDYVHIVDIATDDKILLQQVDENLQLPEYMDAWTDNGIKLVKYDSQNKYNSLQSKFYVLARLPELATANISHTLKITAFDKDNKALYTTYLTIEAVVYPTVVMTYIDPNDKVMAKADTRKDTISHEVEVDADLAIGVEAEIDVVTYNIDPETLKYSITINSGNNGENDHTLEYGNYVRLEYLYGKYYLKFNADMEESWYVLLGKQVNVSFTASKSLNGIVETCKATISFTIRRIVIHSVSMTNTNSGNIHGNWDDGVGEVEEFATEFYFDHTDISYYYRGYWNVKYTLYNTAPDNYEDATQKADMEAINNILKDLNSWNKEENSPIKLYFDDIKTIKESQPITQDKTITNTIDNKSYDIKIKNKDNQFVFNAQTGSNINNMKLMVEFRLNYDANHRPVLSSVVGSTTISNSFGFDVTKPTNPFKDFISVYDQKGFEAMVDGEYYQLADDITLTNYTPLNVAIGGLNGAGKTIKFVQSQDQETHQRYKEFNIAQLILDYTSVGMYIGLFGTLATDSVIQNLQIDYGNTVISLNDNSTIQEQHTNDIYFGGVAGVNLGVITNVKVFGSFKLEAKYVGADHIKLGGVTAVNGASDSEKVATITASTVELDMTSMALVGGVSGINYGKIVNTNFKGSITSNDTNQYVAEIMTAGFVVENMRQGYISLSYVNCETTGTNDIDSVGRTAGFVLNNDGIINNCYIIKTRISSQGNIGGFVYQSTGNISNSYAYALLDNSLFYDEFIYTNSNAGTFTNCYVVSDNSISINVAGLIKITTSNLSNQDVYKGFIFSNNNDAVWVISNIGPKQPNAGFNSNVSILNIYDLTTFDEYFKISSNDGIIENNTFRLVRDIDFAKEGWLDNPSTFNKVLNSSFEGNDMELANYNIYKAGNVDSIGLFASVDASINDGSNDDIYVRNLILKPASIKASNSSAVGALAGVIDGARIYNIIIDNNELLILGKNSVGGLAGLIKGSFEVVGITSNVSVFATYTYATSEQYNLYMGKNVLGEPQLDNIKDVSYAGAIAGIVDGYNNENPKNYRNVYSYYTISNLSINGDLKIIGETVGGAFGLVGERTLVKNLNYNLTSNTLYQGVYVSGGLVGENRGIIQSSNIYAYTYDNGNKQDVDTSLCFDKFARVNGAIVGVNIGGLINDCTSDISVCTTKTTATAGGIAGRNLGGNIYGCAVSGKVNAFFAGGIVGSDYTYETISRQSSGTGTATYETKQVYNFIQSPMVYNINCFVDKSILYNKDILYSENIFTSKFIKNFIAQKGKYYTFNQDYEGSNVQLVNTYSILGLVIGLTDVGLGGENCYNTQIKYDLITDSNTFANVDYVYYKDENGNYKPYAQKPEFDKTLQYYKQTDELTISLVKSSTPSVKDEYKLNEEDDRTVSPSANIVGLLNNYDVYNTSFIYVIAYDSAGYEFWSSTLGYTDNYIAVSKEPLLEPTKQVND